MRKKVLALVLALVMVVAMLPTVAFAAGEDVAQIGSEKYQDLAAALRAAETGETVKLLKATEVGNIQLMSKKDITLDLNGYTVTFSGNAYLYIAVNGTKLTIDDTSEGKNGKITNSAGSTAPTVLIRAGGTLILKNGEIANANTAAKLGAVEVHGSETSPGTVEMDGGKITATGYGITAFDAGKVNVTGGEIKVSGFGISTNGGKDASEGVQITVSGGTITSDNSAGVYLPAGTMTVSGEAKVSGKAGIVVRGGDLTVSGGTIEATGTDEITVGDVGYAVPAAGITVDIANYPEQDGGQKHVTVTEGAKIEAPADGKTIAATKNGAEVEAESGTSGNKVASEENPFDIQGGTLTVNEQSDDGVSKFLRDGYTYENNEITEDPEADFVAQIGTQKYTKLEEAFKAAVAGETVRLIDDVTITGNEDLKIGRSITFDLNGRTLTLAEDHNLYIEADTKAVTIKDSKTGGTIQAKFNTNKTRAGITVDDGAELTVESGTITVTGGTDSFNSGISVWKNSTLTVQGGTINAPGYGIATNGSANTATGAKVNVTGGAITGGKAGMYLPSQGGVTSVTGDAKITGTAGAGIVVRGGTLEVGEDEDGKAPTVTAGGSTAQAYGDNSARLPASAVVVDKNNAYGDAGSAKLKAGTFEAQESVASVTYYEDGQATEETDGVEISGGKYMTGTEGDTSVDAYLSPAVEIDKSTGEIVVAEEKVVAIPNANGETAIVEVGEIDADGYVEVTVSGNISTSHSTVSPSNTWWAGIGFVKPEGATKVSYKINDASDFTENNPVLDTWKNGEAEESGFAYWLDASKPSADGVKIELQWTVGTTTKTSKYLVKLGTDIKVEPFKTEIVDFGYAAEKEAAKTAAAEGRKNANGASYDSEWIQNLDWIDQTMWITFKDPIPDGITLTVSVTTPSGAVEEVTCVGDGKAYTFAWSYKNSAQTGATSVEVGDYTINTTENPVTATQDGKAVDVVVTATATKATVEAGTVKVSIVGAGFKADAEAAKTAINDKWDGDDITDVDANTMWVIFKHDEEQPEGVAYTVNVIKNGEKVHTEDLNGVKKAGVIYVSLENQLKGQGAGEYVFQIVKDGVAVASKAVTVYEVKFEAADGVTLTPATPNKPIYVGTEAEADTVEKPTADVTVTWTKAVEGYTITYTATKYVAPPVSGGTVTPSATVTTPAATNGSYTVSDRNAKAGDTVTITPKADEGYTVDTVVVTDKDGKDVTVTDNGDGTYTFTMPEKASQPVTVKVTFRKVAPSEKFTDVAQDAWYAEYVDYVVENGLMEGTGETTFSPDMTTSRAMLVTILYRLEGKPAVTKDIPFSDVASGEWYSDAINWAAANEIVDGYGDGTFRPDRDLTREEATTILYRYAEYKEYDVTATNDLASYTDAETVSTWADTAMSWAVAEEIIKGTSATELTPAGTAIRAQIAAILMRFCENVAK